jgi:hypothetical protein
MKNNGSVFVLEKRNFYSGLCKSFAHNRFLLQIQPLAVFKLSKSETKQRKN